MEFKKFPVISENGNEYFVDIHKLKVHGLDYLVCGLYSREQTKTKYLKRIKNIDTFLDEYVCVKNMSLTLNKEYEKFENNFKGFVEFVVERYESQKDFKYLEKLRKNIEKAENMKNFDEWDGRCGDNLWNIKI